MNDNIIISTISKIHFILISILSFMFILLFAAFILLQNGLYIDDISFQNIKVKKLYIKWDEKITISANEIAVAKNSSDKNSEIKYKKILQIVKEILPFTNWLKELVIEKITLDGIEGKVQYIDNQKGHLNLASNTFTLKSSFLPNNGLLHIAIDELKAFENGLNINGSIILKANKELDFTALLNIYLDDGTNFNLHLHGNTQKLFYELESKQVIKNAKKIVTLFALEPNIKYWVDDAIEMSGLSIESFSGWFEYKNLDKAYLNLYAKATANDLKYTYDQKLAPVNSAKTDLEFKEGVLYIRPKQAYSYDFYLDRSWLKIDFAKKEELLTLHLLFEAQANKDIVSLLERYEIKLPFIQNKGQVETDLTLGVNLRTLDVEADGSFYVKNAQINYLGLDIDVANADIFLKNSYVKVDNISAKYKDIASADAYMELDAKESKGKLTLKFDKIAHKESSLALANKKKLVAVYNILPKEDYISIGKSTWEYKGKRIEVSAIKVPFRMNELKAHLPVTSVVVPEFGSALLSGDISFKSNRADLDIDIIKINKEGLELSKPTPALKLLYEKGAITLSSKKAISIKIDQKIATFQNAVFSISQDSIRADNIVLNYNDTLKSKISLDYNPKSSSAEVILKDFAMYDNEFNELFKADESIELLLHHKEQKTVIGSKKYDLEYISDNDGWRVDAKSLEKISQHSKILKKYDLTNGSLKIEKKEKQRSIEFLLQSEYKYKFLTTLDKPIESYTAEGSYDLDTKKTNLTINNVVDVEIMDDIKINAKNSGINIKEIISYFTQIKSTQELNSKKKLYIETQNSFLYLAKNRRIVSDRIDLKYIDGTISAELLHNRGRAVFTLRDDKIYLYGDEFGDEFMDKLFALSKFKGGSLEFFINGSLKEFDGMINIKDSTILDYKILNNILAFVNTVPSLVTFSLPGYSKNGIAAERAYINFKFKDDVYKMSDIYLKSKEIEIVGVGEASIEKNSINLDLNLKTDLGSSVSKIPLVGYILLGKENISITLKVTGKLDDPDVTTQIAKDIAVAPFNIIKRTFMFPFEIFK